MLGNHLCCRIPETQQEIVIFAQVRHWSHIAKVDVPNRSAIVVPSPGRQTIVLCHIKFVKFKDHAGNSYHKKRCPIPSFPIRFLALTTSQTELSQICMPIYQELDFVRKPPNLIVIGGNIFAFTFYNLNNAWIAVIEAK